MGSYSWRVKIPIRWRDPLDLNDPTLLPSVNSDFRIMFACGDKTPALL
jgi:hypothetical protein